MKSCPHDELSEILSDINLLNIENIEILGGWSGQIGKRDIQVGSKSCFYRGIFSPFMLRQHANCVMPCRITSSNPFGGFVDWIGIVSQSQASVKEM